MFFFVYHCPSPHNINPGKFTSGLKVVDEHPHGDDHSDEAIANYNLAFIASFRDGDSLRRVNHKHTEQCVCCKIYFTNKKIL